MYLCLVFPPSPGLVWPIKQPVTLEKRFLILGLIFHSSGQRGTIIQLTPINKLQPVSQGTDVSWFRNECVWIKIPNCNTALKNCLYILKEFENVGDSRATNSFVKADKQKEEGEDCFQSVLPGRSAWRTRWEGEESTLQADGVVARGRCICLHPVPKEQLAGGTLLWPWSWGSDLAHPAPSRLQQ